MKNRSYQIWWVAFVKFDKSLSSSLMSRFVKFLSFRKIELILFVISKKLESNSWNINNEMIKHDHENEFKVIFSAKEKIWNRISRSHFTFRDKTQQDTLLAFSQHVVFFERTFLIVRERKKLSKRKTDYNRHVLEKREIKIFKTNRLFLFIIVCYLKV
jgi:hypothetical protein